MFDRKILYFLTVAEEGSFSAAARRYYMSQSACSQQVRLLEEELNAQLFNRNGYRPILTEAGKIFYEGCFQLKTRYEELVEQIHSTGAFEINVGFTGVTTNHRLIEAIKSLKRNNGAMPVSMHRVASDLMCDALQEGKIQVAFGVDAWFENCSNIIYEKLYDYKISVLCNKNHPFANQSVIYPYELENEEFVVLSKKSYPKTLRAVMAACKEDGLVPKVRKYVDTFDDLLLEISLGQGIAVASVEVGNEEDVVAIPLMNSHHQSGYVVAYKNDISSKVKESFINPIINGFTAKLY